MRMSKVRDQLTIVLSRELLDWLEREASADDRSMSCVCRRVLEQARRAQAARAQRTTDRSEERAA
jgi:hypothetical protein